MKAKLKYDDSQLKAVDARLRSATNLLDMKKYDQAQAQIDMARILLNELFED